MGKNNFIIGCPDPYSLAEEVTGKQINWSEVKDEFDALADSFGITKEGYLEDASPLMNPYLKLDENGNAVRLSDQEAEKRLTDYLENNARPEKPVHRKAKKDGVEDSAEGTVKEPALSQAEKRRRVVGTLLQKKPTSSVSPRKLDLSKEEGVGDGETPFLMDGFEWRDKGYFFNETALWSDVCQNSIGDCYFLSALCSLAYVNSFKIKNVTGLRYKYKSKEGVREFAPWHAIEFYVPSSSTSDLKNWKGQEKKVQTMVVSEEVLVNRSTGRNYGASGPKEKNGIVNGNKADLDSCWAAVYEKAYAKFLENAVSDYPNMGPESLLRGGWPDEALKELIHTEQVASKSTDKMSINDIWNIATAARNHPSCATISYEKAGPSSEYSKMGLYMSHAYSLLGTYTDGNTKYIVLRNPHGRNPAALKNNPKVYHKNWGFNFGVDREDKYDDLLDIFRRLSGTDDPLKSNGLFLLEVNEFKRVFTSVDYYYGNAFTGRA